MESPLVTVALFLYNSEQFIEKSLQSILSQTYSKIEVLVINDCSTDNSLDIVKSLSDNRVRLINNERNLGIAKARAIAIEQSLGKYIFWMDHDDISSRERIEHQVAKFESDPEIILCGTCSKIINEYDEVIGVMRPPSLDPEIKAGLFFGFPFISPTVGLRKSIISSECLDAIRKVEQADDYVLYSALLGKGKFQNIDKELYYYRSHTWAGRITTDPKKGQDIISGRKSAWNLQLSFLELDFDYQLLDLHNYLSYYLNEEFALSYEIAEAYFNALKGFKKHATMKWPLAEPFVSRNVELFYSRILQAKSLTFNDAVKLYFTHLSQFPFGVSVKSMIKKCLNSFGK